MGALMHRLSLCFIALLLGSAVLIPPASPLPAAEPSQQIKDFEEARKRGTDAEKNREWLKAVKAFEDVIRLGPQAYSDWNKDKSEAGYRLEIGLCYRYAGEMDKGEAALRKSLALYEDKQDEAKKARLHNELGDLNRERGRYWQAEDELKEAVRICETQNIRWLLILAQSNLGYVYGELGQFSEAEKHFTGALDLATKEDKAASEAVKTNDAKTVDNARKAAKAKAGCLNDCAWLSRQKGDLDEAAARYQDAFKIYQDQKASLEEATCRQNLGFVTYRLGQYDEAEKYYLKAQEIRKDQLPPYHMHVVQTACGLGYVYLSRRSPGDLKKAQDLFERTRKGLGDDHLAEHPDRARLFHGLGDLYQALGKSADAQQHYQLAEDVWKKVAKQGERSVDEALTLGRMGWLLQAGGKYNSAKELFQDALDLRLAKLSASHPDVAMSQDNLAGLYAAQGKWTDAARLAEQARQNSHRYVRHILPAQREEVQLSFLRLQHEDDLHAALSIGWARRSDPEMARATAVWLVNSKGLVHETLAEQKLMERDLRDPNRAKLVGRLREVRRQLSALTFGDISLKQLESRRKEMDLLGQEEQELGEKLVKSSGRRAEGQNWVNLEEVRQGLPPDAVLIEIARLRIWDFQVKGIERVWQPEHYVAWLIPAPGPAPVRVVDLGEAAKTDKAVQDVRDAFESATQIYEKDPSALATKKSEQTIRRPLQALGDVILKPLLPHLTACQHLIIGGDGDLWLVPWAALPLEEGYAIERFQVTYLVTGRDLVGKRSPATSTAPVIFADPDYDLAGNGAPAPSGPPVKRLLGKAERLENSRGEAQAVIPSLKELTGKDATLVVGADATKVAFQKVVRPEVLFVSTHGFALGDKEVAEGLVRPNPWLHSGLAFAGCNRPVARNGDNGILTANEILDMDLRGTRLVALSACQTGLGKVVRGDGVRGLHQAFQLAGARTVLATLWSVPDEETRGLTTTLFSKLAKNKGRIGAALREAQLEKIHSDRESFDTTHPFYWGAFTLTGVDRD
jgi:CHAT domain-containing protein/Tfp pilus assembly protein PilF